MKRMFFIFSFIACFIFLFFFSVIPQYAAETPVDKPPCFDFDDKTGTCLSVDTPLGPISTDPGGLISKIFLILLSIAGAMAVILIMRSGYKIMTARGNPEGIQQGREQLVAAIVGLMFLIFSFVFLQVLAKDLLGIPGFR